MINPSSVVCTLRGVLELKFLAFASTSRVHSPLPCQKKTGPDIRTIDPCSSPPLGMNTRKRSPWFMRMSNRHRLESAKIRYDNTYVVKRIIHIPNQGCHLNPRVRHFPFVRRPSKLASTLDIGHLRRCPRIVRLYHAFSNINGQK